MLATLPVVALIAVFFGRYIRKLSTQVQDRIADTNVIVDETLQGIQNVKAFSNESFEVGPLPQQRAEGARPRAERRALARGVRVVHHFLHVRGYRLHHLAGHSPAHRRLAGSGRHHLVLGPLHHDRGVHRQRSRAGNHDAESRGCHRTPDGPAGRHAGSHQP
jgi:hypothetical protein